MTKAYSRLGRLVRALIVLGDNTNELPLGTGKMSCVGKNLSLLETRVCAALLLNNFDFEFAPGETGGHIISEMIDYFTGSPGAMNVVLKERAVTWEA